MHRSDSLRLFVAIYPPPDLAAAMVAALAPLPLPEHRVTPAEQVHLTLVFIGDRRARELRDVRESVERSCSGLPAFQLLPQALITIPTPAQGGPPRLVAATTDAPPTLLELQRRLATRLARPDERRKTFTPHLTLARFAQGRSSPPIDHPLALSAFGVDGVRLVSSVLGRTGARHDVVAEFPLSA